MSKQIIQHSVVPTTNKIGNAWSAYDQCDFDLVFPNRKILANSIRLEADLEILVDGQDRPAATDELYFDEMIGAHAFIDGIVTEFATMGKVEVMSKNYARLARMITDGTMCVSDMFNSHNLCELRSGNQNISKVLARGQVPNIEDGPTKAALTLDQDFSMKPYCILNQAVAMQEGLGISYTKTGKITMTFTLGRVAGAVFGPAVTAATTYAIKNPRLTFLSVPEDGVNNMVSLQSVSSYKQTIVSNMHNLSVNVPRVVKACFVSFQASDHENKKDYNNAVCEVLPNLRELQFLYNNNTNENIQYVIRSRPEMLMRYVDALSSTGRNNVSVSRVAENQSFGIGLKMAPVDLSNQTFNISLVSDADSTNKYNAYMYFVSSTTM